MKKIDNKDLSYCKKMANKSIKKYIVMTIWGIALFNLGLILWIISLVIIGTRPSSNDVAAIVLMVFGFVLMLGPGLALMGVGTPIWISLGVQIKVAKNKLAKTDK